MMNNTKIGVLIKHTDGGEREVYSHNKSNTLTNGSNDIRSIFRLFSTPPKGKDLILMRFLGNEGVLIAITRLANNPSRGDDNSTAWIHIPDKLDFSGDDLAKLIDLVKSEMVDKNPDFERITKGIDNMDFKPKDVSQAKLSHISSPNDGNAYAYMLYGEGTDFQLYELLDSKSLAQEEYKKYSGIILLNNKDSLSFNPDKKIENLKSPLRKTLILSVPIDKTNNFQPYYEGRKFEKPIEVYVVDPIELEWRRDGFKEVIKTHTVKESDRDNSSWYKALLPKETEILHRIYKSYFKVSDESGNPVQFFDLTIDGNSIINDNVYFSKDELEKEKKVTIDAEGYEQYKDNLVLKNSPTITLKRKEIRYHIVLNNGKTGELTIYGRDGSHGTNGESPLKNYELHKGKLIYKDVTTTPAPQSPKKDKRWFEKRWIQDLKLLIIGIAVGGIIGYILSSYNEQQRQQQQSDTNEYQHSDNNGKEVENTEQSPSSIAEYMADNTTWDKMKLDGDTKTKGLYEALIDLNETKIREICNKVQFEKFNDILSKLKKLSKDQKNSIKNKIQSKFKNDPINVDDYITSISHELKRMEANKPTASQEGTGKTNENSPTNNKEDKEASPNKRNQKK